jgi:CheY-like chemotaxis protein
MKLTWTIMGIITTRFLMHEGLILDLHLPFAFGGDILNVIRAKYPDTIIAVVTADFIKAKTLVGADHILIKPVSVASLLRLAESIKG